MGHYFLDIQYYKYKGFDRDFASSSESVKKVRIMRSTHCREFLYKVKIVDKNLGKPISDINQDVDPDPSNCKVQTLVIGDIFFNRDPFQDKLI